MQREIAEGGTGARGHPKKLEGSGVRDECSPGIMRRARKRTPPDGIIERGPKLHGVVETRTRDEGESQALTRSSTGPDRRDAQLNGTAGLDYLKVSHGCTVIATRDEIAEPAQADQEIAQGGIATSPHLKPTASGSESSDWNGHQFHRSADSGARKIEERVVNVSSVCSDGDAVGGC